MAIVGSSYVQKVLEERLGEEVRTTVLRHVQRSTASAFDRLLERMGHRPSKLSWVNRNRSVVIGIRDNRIATTLDALRRAGPAVAKAISQGF
jgi:6-phosphofructokinase